MYSFFRVERRQIMNYLKKYIKLDENVNGVTGLTDELFSYYLYCMLKEKQRNILLVTNSLFEAHKFYKMISDYTSQVFLFPMDEFLTSEDIAISPEFKVTR